MGYARGVLREVSALSHCESHVNVVKYNAAWAELVTERALSGVLQCVLQRVLQSNVKYNAAWAELVTEPALSGVLQCVVQCVLQCVLQ